MLRLEKKLNISILKLYNRMHDKITIMTTALNELEDDGERNKLINEEMGKTIGIASLIIEKIENKPYLSHYLRDILNNMIEIRNDLEGLVFLRDPAGKGL